MAIDPNMLSALQGLSKVGRKNREADSSRVRKAIVSNGFLNDIPALRAKSERYATKSDALALAAKAHELCETDPNEALKLATKARELMLSLKNQGADENEN